MPDKSKIIVAKPRVGGVLFHAPAGTELPTDAQSPLSDAFVEAGYISEDGILYNKTRSTEDLKDMGQQNVRPMQSEYSETAQFSMLEYLNKEALKISFGDDNVEGDIESGIIIRSRADELPAGVYVFDMVDGNTLIRHVLPLAQVSEQGELEYKGGAAVMLPVTLKLSPYAEWSGDYHREYIKKISTVSKAKLSALTLGSLGLTPAFNPDVASYTATTTNATNVVTATAEHDDSAVVITCGDATYNSGDSITWEEGTNTVEIKVTNGNEVKVYTVVVTKE